MLREKLKTYMSETVVYWPRLSFYERFEQVVAFILSFVIMVVIVVALVELIGKVARMLLAGALDPLEHAVFQNVFGAIMTLLIAMEFKHSIIRVVERKESIIQVKTVVMIAILALARKFIIIDTAKTGADTLVALAATVLALGIVYWLMRERDDYQQRRLSEMARENDPTSDSTTRSEQP
ncbi:MAG TPA: diguanylate cyclase [Gammaproteobacteria bacterium]|nr:diguanylate cyclase [Gammaproteobacteria bacterium]